MTLTQRCQIQAICPGYLPFAVESDNCLRSEICYSAMHMTEQSLHHLTLLSSTLILRPLQVNLMLINVGKSPTV